MPGGTGFRLCSFAFALILALTPTANSQSSKPATEPAQSAAKSTEQNAAQIELLETRYRFETNGDSRKEVHTRVRINNELGARQFAKLNFDFNRSFQSVEIPQVRITHASGGIADILPSAITDNPNPAVVDYPAYHDVRVKSVRILGLAPGDLLEYRVITTTTHHPLAPDFWLDHTFDRTGVVTHEIFELNLPALSKPAVKINPATPATSRENSGEGDSARETFVWNKVEEKKSEQSEPANEADVLLTTCGSWLQLSDKLGALLETSVVQSPAVRAKAAELSSNLKIDKEKLEAFYNFVSKDIKTVDLPLGSTAFKTRQPDEILSSRYATPEDKFSIFYGLVLAIRGQAHLALFGSQKQASKLRPIPSLFTNSAILVSNFSRPLVDLGNRRYDTCDHCGEDIWLDPSMEVAPFEALPVALRGRQVFVVKYTADILPFATVPESLPFPSRQDVSIQGQIEPNGGLQVRTKYLLRGDNELLLRVAFHKTEREKWKDVAQMLALSDGFRGKVVNVTASDPYATKAPFTVEYEISQPKFVDWSKKTVRIPAILPLPGLPDPPTAEQIKSGDPIELGTPLTIDLESSVELPAGAVAQAPIGTTVNRDYATFSSKYSVEGNKLHASRSLHFLLSELPASRATDLNAFLHAVQADQSQTFSVQPPAAK